MRLMIMHHDEHSTIALLHYMYLHLTLNLNVPHYLNMLIMHHMLYLVVFQPQLVNLNIEFNMGYKQKTNVFYEYK